MQYSIAPPPMNPLARLLAALLGVLALVGAFFFGIFIFVFALALGRVAWLAFSVRMWWLRRQLEGADPFSGAPAAGHRPADDTGEIIDGEYEVIDREEKD